MPACLWNCCPCHDIQLNKYCIYLLFAVLAGWGTYGQHASVWQWDHHHLPVGWRAQHLPPGPPGPGLPHHHLQHQLLPQHKQLLSLRRCLPAALAGNAEELLLARPRWRYSLLVRKWWVGFDGDCGGGEGLCLKLVGGLWRWLWWWWGLVSGNGGWALMVTVVVVVVRACVWKWWVGFDNDCGGGGEDLCQKMVGGLWWWLWWWWWGLVSENGGWALTVTVVVVRACVW